MNTDRMRVWFLNAGHFIDHFCMLIFATAVIAMAERFDMTYGSLLAVATPILPKMPFTPRRKPSLGAP